MKLINKIATLVFFISLISCAHNREKSNPPPVDGLTDAQLDHIDDQPEACNAGAVLADGKSVYDVIKKMPQFAQQAEAEKRVDERAKLPKSLKDVGGIELSADPTTLRRVTLNELQIYDSPDGKLIDIYPKNLAVLIKGRKDKWAFVQGYWSYQCNYGWTLEKNLVFKSRKELEALDLFGR